MAQPRGSLPHDDHFHIRVACPPGMDKCIELPTAQRHRKRTHPAATAQAKPAPAAPAAQPKPAPHPPAATPAKPAPPPVKSDETAAADSMPSLAPIVPGLDSAVIPKPIEGFAPPPQNVPAPAPTPAPPAIDDPDGIYEQR